MQSKRGWSFSFDLILSLAFPLLLLFTYLALTENNGSWSYSLGEKQYSILDAWDQMHESEIKHKSQATIALLQALPLVHAKGGLSTADCGAYLGYNLWYGGSEGEPHPCFSMNALEKSLTTEFTDQLEMISNLPMDLYSFSFSPPFTIFALAKKAVPIPIYCQPEFQASCGRIMHRPSFQSSLDYDLFGAYREIESKVPSLLTEIGKCTSSENILQKQCIGSVLLGINSPRLTWFSDSDCDTQPLAHITPVMDAIDSCANSIDTNCLCSIPFPNQNQKVESEFKSMFITGTGSALEFTLQGRGTDSTLILTSPTAINLKKFQLTLDQTSITEAGSTFFLKKSGKHLQRLSEIPSSQLPLCAPLKRHYRFCVKDAKNTLPLITSNSKEAKSSNIRFGLTVHDTTPPPAVSGIRLMDNPKAEKSLIVVFEKSKSNDVAFYAIYADASPLTRLRLHQNQKHTTIASLRKKVSPLSVQTLMSIDLDHPLKEIGSARYRVTTLDGDVQELTLAKNQLYYFTQQGSSSLYLTILDSVPENQPISIGVSAVDYGGNEVSEITALSARSTDDLAPGLVNIQSITRGGETLGVRWERPQNEDGSKADDIALYTLYCHSGQLRRSESGTMILQTTKEEASLSDPICLTENSYVGVVATDTTGNELHEVESRSAN